MSLPMNLASIVNAVERVVDSNNAVMVHTQPGRATWTTLHEALLTTGRPLLDIRLYAFDTPLVLAEDSNHILFVSEFADALVGKRLLLEVLRNKPKNVAVVCVSLEKTSNLPALDNRLIHLYREY